MMGKKTLVASTALLSKERDGFFKIARKNKRDAEKQKCPLFVNTLPPTNSNKTRSSAVPWRFSPDLCAAKTQPKK
jgi:hypothetical protein